MKNEKNISYASPHSLSKLPQNTPVLLALSGGADSSALLHVLNDDAQKNGYTLHAAHFNHGIRGEEAERDADFCKNICASLNIPFHLGKADVPTLAKENGNSVEAEAREQRYAFFERIMRENGIPILATAHHAEDQAETVLLHIIRGSGIKGLCGIQPCRSFATDFYLVRPLLNSKKEDILTFCKENDIAFVTDSTNSDTKYTRNALRTEIIPKLYELQPNLCEIFERLSKSACETDVFLSACAMKFIETECTPNIPIEKFNQLFNAEKAKIISLLFEEKFDSNLERVHIDSVIELCQKAAPNSSISLPKKTRARIENGNLVFEKENENSNLDGFESIPFREGIIDTKCGITIKIEKNPTNTSHKSPSILDVKCELISKDAHFRPRREGDVIFSGKMNKKIKKLISEKKIPLEKRKNLPLLVSNNEILWIPSVAVCDRVKMDKINDGDDFFRIIVT